MKTSFFFVFLLFTALNLNCSTHYRAARSCCVADPPGYSDIKLEDNTFRITFKANAFTKKERVFDFALLRAAEVIIDNNFEYFIVLNEDDYNITGTGVFVADDSLFEETKINLIIECFKEKPVSDKKIYDSLEIIDEIPEKYGFDLYE